MRKLVKLMARLCSVYDEDLRNLAEELEFGLEEDLSRKMGSFLLTSKQGTKRSLG